jgi:hypothetical protein
MDNIYDSTMPLGEFDMDALLPSSGDGWCGNLSNGQDMRVRTTPSGQYEVSVFEGAALQRLTIIGTVGQLATFFKIIRCEDFFFANSKF